MEQVEQEKELVKWRASARPYKPLSRQLFMTGVAIAILVGVILAFAGEWALILVVGAMVFAYYVWSTVPPEETEYGMTTQGVKVHGQVYKWEELGRWWVEEKWGTRLVVIEAPVSISRRLFLVLGSGEEKKIAEVLNKYLVMEKPIETQMDKAGKWLMEKFPLEK